MSPLESMTGASRGTEGSARIPNLTGHLYEHLSWQRLQ